MRVAAEKKDIWGRENVEKMSLLFLSLSSVVLILGFDTLTIMHTNSSFFLSDLHFCLLLFRVAFVVVCER